MRTPSIRSLVLEISKATHVSQTAVGAVIKAMTIRIGEELASGHDFLLGNVGKLTLRYRAERHRKAPQVVTVLKGSAVIPPKVIPAHVVVKFVPTPRLKARLDTVDPTNIRRDKRRRHSFFSTSNPPLPVADSGTPTPPHPVSP